ncbi:unnamed protein product, partial [Ostreobium quekettii]
EVNAIVIDVGSGSTRVGYAGDDTPKAVYPSCVGSVIVNGQDGDSINNGETEKKTFVGLSALGYRRDGMEILAPVSREGYYEQWDLIEALWDHAFRERLRLNPEEHPMLVCEPTVTPTNLREKLVELVFEKYSPPATFLARNAVLSSFATGRQTSVVVDSGHQGTTVAAIHEGYALLKSITWTPLGGKLLTECMLQCVDPDRSLIRPRYSFKRVETSQGQFEVVDRNFPKTTQSYRKYCIDQIATDIKESVCRVSDSTFVEGDNTNIPTVTYELPDGQEIQVGLHRFKVPEVLFQPELIKTFGGMPDVCLPDGSELSNLPSVVAECINKCDVDIRRELYTGIILTGGTSLFSQMRERLEKELIDIAPQAVRVKTISPVNTIERRFSVWIGGSILASLGSFQQMWMSKMEYEEHGASLIHRRAP